jgi:predicted transcriptional regulator of viral defense system
MQPIKQLARVLALLADREHCVFVASDLAAAVPDCRQWAVLLSRATKARLVRRVCRGVYWVPVPDYPRENLLYHVAARLRAGEFNFISMETVLSEAGVISQVPINWITLMSSGRSHVVNCGDRGRIEFVHTAQRPDEVAAELNWDQGKHLWRASVKQALRDLHATRRPSRDLIDKEALRDAV